MIIFMVILASFFSALFGGVAELVTKPEILPIVIGAGIKHLDKVPVLGRVTKLIPNGAIPLFNLGLSMVVPQYGAAQALAATGWHQIGKRAIRAVANVALRKSTPDSGIAKLAKAVGPGDQLSI